MMLVYKEYKWLLIVFLILIIFFSYFIYRDFQDEQFQKEYEQFISKDIIPSISGLKPLDGGTYYKWSMLEGAILNTETLSISVGDSFERISIPDKFSFMRDIREKISSKRYYLIQKYGIRESNRTDIKVEIQSTKGVYSMDIISMITPSGEEYRESDINKMTSVDQVEVNSCMDTRKGSSARIRCIKIKVEKLCGKFMGHGLDAKAFTPSGYVPYTELLDNCIKKNIDKEDWPHYVES